MNIQSSSAHRQPLQNRRELGAKYAKAREEFQSKSNDHFERAENHEKWGTRLSFGAGAGVLVGGGFLVHKFAPGLDGYGAAFPPVFAAAATVGLGMFITNKLLEKKLSETGFQQSRENFVGIRDQYREAMLEEIDDAGVSSITQARWDALKPYEDIQAKQPTRVERSLLEKVDRLEYLADSRIAGGWIQELAHAQDDPVLFQNEVKTVERHSGIHTVLKKAHGEG